MSVGGGTKLKEKHGRRVERETFLKVLNQIKSLESFSLEKFRIGARIRLGNYFNLV